MKFRDDIDIENTWVVSDTHFGHDNIVGFCHRPEDHEQVIIAEWRKEVPDDATVLHLGDLAYKRNAWFKNIVAPELSGARKLLIRGNHDRNPRKFYTDCGFKTVLPFKISFPLVGTELTSECCDWQHCGQCQGTGEVTTGPMLADVSFSHYVWNTAKEGTMPPEHIRIHGHIHNNGYTRDSYVPFLLNHINVSVEQTKYKPVNLKLLLDAALLGVYQETTDEQLAEARARKETNRA